MIEISSLAGALLLLAPTAPSVAGQAIAEHGSAHGAPACQSCHGLHYQGQPAMMAPALAGKPAGYIVARLAHYAGPDGHNALMKQVATALTPAERQAVADYLSHLPSPASASGRP